MLPIAYSIPQLHDKEKPKVPWGRSQTYLYIKSGQLNPRYVGDKPIILGCEVEQLILSLPKEKA